MHNPATRIKPHSNEWYDRLSRLQDGYCYPWTSRISEGGGEAAFLDLVRAHLDPELDVLDAGCGHGEVALEMAPLCRSMRGYDRVDRFIDMARRAAREGGVDNVTFTCANSRQEANGGRVRVPVPSASVDLVISRRGPTHWIEDVRRFCRPGAVLIQLNPLAAIVEPAWNRDLPEGLRLTPPDPNPDAGMRAAIERRLSLVQLRIHSCWTYDVPEWSPEPREFYRVLVFGCAEEEVPSWPQAEATVTAIFERYAGPEGLEWRNRRFLWMAVLDQ